MWNVSLSITTVYQSDFKSTLVVFLSFLYDVYNFLKWSCYKSNFIYINRVKLTCGPISCSVLRTAQRYKELESWYVEKKDYHCQFCQKHLVIQLTITYLDKCRYYVLEITRVPCSVIHHTITPLPSPHALTSLLHLCPILPLLTRVYFFPPSLPDSSPSIT